MFKRLAARVICGSHRESANSPPEGLARDANNLSTFNLNLYINKKVKDIISTSYTSKVGVSFFQS